MGSKIGELHAATRDLPLERVAYTPQVLLAEPMEQIKKFLAKDSPEWAFMESVRDTITALLRAADGTQLRRGAVHLDIWFDNLNISKEGEVTPLSDEERRLIPAWGICTYFFYLGVQCRRYENWSNRFLSEDYLKRFINMLIKKYYDLYKIGGEKI